MILGLVQKAVVTNAVPTPAQLQDIRGPIDLAWLAPWMVRALLVVPPLAILLWIWWRRRKGRPTPERIRETAAARARARLSEAWGFVDQPDRFCTLLSEIVRVYLEERFGLRAPDRTTEEFLEGLRDSIVLDLRHKQMLGDFLTRCDLVKFARGEPGRPDLDALHAMAAALVDETGAVAPPLPGKEVAA